MSKIRDGTVLVMVSVIPRPPRIAVTDRNARRLPLLAGARIAPYVGDDLIAKLENPIVFQSFNAVANALDSGCKASNPMPRDHGTGGVKNDHDRACITVIFGIAGDVPSDAGAVLDSYFSRAK
nr:hypothetical protein [Bradyrhizobium canariense]